MPLRDHFRPPVSKRARGRRSTACGRRRSSANSVPRSRRGYMAGPRVHLGTFYEIDVSAYESDDAPAPAARAAGNGNGGVAVASWAATEPNVAVEVAPDEEYEYAVHVYDAEREQTLVAAIEIVSPANKDRPEKRNSFVAKCAALLRAGVSLSASWTWSRSGTSTCTPS